MDVKPWVVDVTSAFLDGKTKRKATDEEEDGYGDEKEQSEGESKGGSEVEVDYQAMMYSWENKTWILPQSASASGYVIMSSNLVFYHHKSVPASSPTGSTNPSHSADMSEASELSSRYVNTSAITLASFVLFFLLIFCTAILIYFWRRKSLSSPLSLSLSSRPRSLSSQVDQENLIWLMCHMVAYFLMIKTFECILYI